MTQTKVPYLDKAMAKLAKMDLIPKSSSSMPAMGTLKQIESVDPDRVMSVARTLQRESDFNAVVRDNIHAMTVANRYQDIADAFVSVRQDTKTLFHQMEKGKLSLADKAKQTWMKTRRGTIGDRFDKIRKTFIEVTNDSKVTIERERAILDAYADFRLALKQGEIDAQGLHEEAAKQLTDVQCKYDNAARAVTDAGERGDNDRAVSELQLERDSIKRELDAAIKKEQIAKDLAENLKISYSTSESIMGRLQQTTDVKERVYEQSVTFFSTNENVFTALSASVTSMQGLHESTETLNSLKQGANQSLEDLADTGNTVLERGIEAGYGPTISADSVKRLVDSIVEFEEQTRAKTQEMRELSTENAQKIAEYTEEGKRRYAEIVSQPAG